MPRKTTTSKASKRAAVKRSVLEPLGKAKTDEATPVAPVDKTGDDTTRLTAKAATPAQKPAHVCLYTVNMPGYSYNTGAVLKNLSDEQIKRLTAAGAIEEVKE